MEPVTINDPRPLLIYDGIGLISEPSNEAIGVGLHKLDAISRVAQALPFSRRVSAEIAAKDPLRTT
jgi:hypothetical protein